MTETQLRNAIRHYLAGLRRSGMAIKFVKYPGGPFGEAGTPDWHVTINGRSIWFEAKVGGRMPTAMQRRRLAEWKAAGAITGIVRSVEDVEKLIAGTFRQ